MSLIDYLVKEKTVLELAQTVASQAKEIARLKNEVKTLQVQMFWQGVAQRKEEHEGLRQMDGRAEASGTTTRRTA